jgi:predicted esterase
LSRISCSHDGVTRWLFAFVLVLGACKKSPPKPLLSALEGGAPTLAVPGFGAAVVSVPAGATRPMPVVVAVLGIGDTPEEQCAAWKDIVGARAFVLCPRGSVRMVPDDEADAGDEARDDDEPVEAGRKMHAAGFWPVNVETLDREVGAGLAALRAKYGSYVGDSVVYAGFSRGAFLGASLAAKRAAIFRRVVLIEGGQSPWQTESIDAFLKGGGKRVLFVCGQPSCVEESDAAARLLKARGVETRVVHGAGEGHGYKKQVKQQLLGAFDWLVDGDPAW